MSILNPRTWITGEFVRAALLNRELRDLPAQLKAGIYPIGFIKQTAKSSAPTNWMICDGSAISRTTYASLFNVVGTTHGPGNGSTTFNLPDCRGRFVLHVGGGHALAATGGLTEVTLGTGHLAQHNHTGGLHEHAFTNVQINVNFFPAEVAFYGAVPIDSELSNGEVLTRNSIGGTTGNTGDGDPFSVMNSHVALNYIIKAQ